MNRAAICSRTDYPAMGGNKLVTENQAHKWYRRRPWPTAVVEPKKKKKKNHSHHPCGAKWTLKSGLLRVDKFRRARLPVSLSIAIHFACMQSCILSIVFMCVAGWCAAELQCLQPWQMHESVFAFTAAAVRSTFCILSGMSLCVSSGMVDSFFAVPLLSLVS